MSEIIISADCTCDIPESILKENSVRIIPFYIKVNGVRFQEGAEVDSKMISEYFDNDDADVSSTPPSVEEYRNYFLEFASDRNISVLHFSVSSKLSASYENAVQAVKGINNVHVIDTGLFSHGVVLMILAVAELIKSGATVEKICDEIKNIREKISCTFALKTTLHASKNSRVGQTTQYLISLFNIKPMLKIRDGELKVNGLSTSNVTTYAKKYIKKTLKNINKISDKVLFITTSGCSEELKHLIYTEATAKIDWKRIYVQEVSAVNYCNIGAESFAIMFYTK